jgi:transcription elongation factor Elf1
MKLIIKKEKRRVPVTKLKTVTIKVVYCPKCDRELEKVTDLDAMTMMTYRCRNCDYKY